MSKTKYTSELNSKLIRVLNEDAELLKSLSQRLDVSIAHLLNQILRYWESQGRPHIPGPEK